ncbi:MAG TPA: hypothetical protein VNF00_00270 [Candidatus Acidoferrales bacterium]|nr:hypothetical protein [Candidatus Acidoferrales bacterium]
MVRTASFACVLGIALGLALPLAAQTPKVRKTIAKDEAKYERETKPVSRAKEVVKLGRAEYKAARQCVDAGNISGALQFLANYNDQANAAHDALDKMGLDAEKHSNGFRQLQISTRESLRQLRDIAGRVPFEQSQPFRALEKNLDALNQKLILELFPRQPGHKIEDEKKKH